MLTSFQLKKPEPYQLSMDDYLDYLTLDRVASSPEYLDYLARNGIDDSLIDRTYDRVRDERMVS